MCDSLWSFRERSLDPALSHSVFSRYLSISILTNSLTPHSCSDLHALCLSALKAWVKGGKQLGSKQDITITFRVGDALAMDLVSERGRQSRDSCLAGSTSRPCLPDDITPLISYNSTCMSAQGSPTVVYCNLACFDGHMCSALVSKLLRLRSGTFVITSTKKIGQLSHCLSVCLSDPYPTPRPFSCMSNTLPPPRSLLLDSPLYLLLESSTGAMSFGEAAFYIHRRSDESYDEEPTDKEVLEVLMKERLYDE